MIDKDRIKPFKKTDLKEEEKNETQEGQGFEKMMELYEESFKKVEEGSVIKGRVLSVAPEGVTVDIGYKSEGIIPIHEFTPEHLSKIKAGDEIEVYLEEKEDAEGNVVLSKDKAGTMKIWSEVEKVYSRGGVIDGRIVSRIKGGLVVDVWGLKAFLPGSHIDLRPPKDMDRLMGNTFPMKILKMNRKRGNIILSRRALLEESLDQRRKKILATLEEGKVVEGTVKNITEYGAFVDLGGIDGLLHITDMSWGRVSHPSELFVIGDRIQVKILKYDRQTGRVSLGLKQMTQDPWSDVDKKYSVGSRVRGKVTSLTDYGAFIELEPGVEGLIHISEMSWTHEVRHPSKIVAVGDVIDAAVLNIDKDNRKISLGMKQVEPNPWEIVEKKYPSGTKIEGKIKNLTEFGAFVGLEEGIDGLIHISDMSWTKHIKHPSEVLKKGQKVEAVVLKVDREKERISLSLKHLTPDPWESEIPNKYRVGETVKGKIVKIADFGLFVEMEEGVEGLVHISEVGFETPARLEGTFSFGQEVMAKVVKVDTAERKIALSIREYQRELEQKELQEYLDSQEKKDPEATVKKVTRKKKKESEDKE